MDFESLKNFLAVSLIVCAHPFESFTAQLAKLAKLVIEAGSHPAFAFLAVRVFYFAYSRSNFVVHALHDPPARIMKTVQCWNLIQVDPAVSNTVPGCMQMLSSTGDDNMRSRTAMTANC